MNRPSDSKYEMDDIHYVSNEELFSYGYDRKTKASIFYLTKTKIGLWTTENKRYVIQRSNRISHREIKLGEMVEFIVEQMETKRMLQFRVVFIGKDNSMLPYKKRTKQANKKSITKIKELPQGDHLIKIHKDEDNILTIEMNGNDYRIKKPTNKQWIDKEIGIEFKAWVEIEFRKIKNSDGEYKDQELGFLKNSLEITS